MPTVAASPSPALHRLAASTAAATLLLLFAGGLVTSTGSGLAVPDWPLSFGQVFPRMEGGVLFEHGHRLIASGVGCLTLILALWTVVADTRPAIRALGLVALFVVVVQGVLGGVTVLYRLPLAVSVTHACLAQTFFCLTVALTLVTSRTWQAPPALPAGATRPLATAAAVATAACFVQLVLGALMRHMHAGLAIPDFPLAFGRLIPPLVTAFIQVHFAHRVGALVVAVAVGWAVARALRRHGDVAWLRRPALLAAALVVLQITLGALTIWSQRAVAIATLHLVVGASVLATCLVLALRAARLAAPAHPAAGRAPVPAGSVAA